MKGRLTILTSLFVALFFWSSASPQQTQALSASDWQAGRIIDDAVFTDSNSMTAAEIQAFLDQKVGRNGFDSIPGECDTFGERSARPFSTLTRRDYMESRGFQPNYTFTCLNNYYEVPKTSPGPAMPYSNYGNQPGDPNPPGSRSAAWIIHDAAQTYNISPKVLLVILQKESAGPLITDDWPLESQFRYAMGARCPDGPNGAECDPDYAGFSIQMYEGARLLRWYLDSMDQSWWPYRKPNSNNTVLYHPNNSCGSSNVYIESYATAALYTYTPYQPNRAALDNLYSTGDSCSSYGNRNFWRMYIDWFGSPLATTAFAWLIENPEVYTNVDRTREFTTTTTVTPNEKIYLRVSARNMGHKTWDNSFIRLGTASPQDRTSPFQDESWLGATRVTSLLESSVRPGEVGTFEFVLQAPEQPGSYKEVFKGVAEARQWFSGPTIPFNIDVVEPVAASNRNNVALQPGDELKPGQYLLSPDRHTTLVLQENGNLVLNTHFRTVWSTQTSGKKPGKLIMQGDGNLVLYSTTGTVLWHSRTFGNSGARLTTQTDGNLVIYASDDSPLWSSRTVHRPNNLNMVNKILPKATFYPGQILQTADKRFRLVLQTDGNLVLYSQNRATWASYTVGKGATRLVMQGDGNLVLYDDAGKPVWHTRTNGKGESRLVIQPDGNLVLYNSNSNPTWHTRTNGVE